MKRHSYQDEAHFHELTYSCYKNLPLFDEPKNRTQYVEHILQTRKKLSLPIVAYVVMPNHIHLLVGITEIPVSTILRELKSPYAYRTIRTWKEEDNPILHKLIDKQGGIRLWQRGGGYDRNFWQRNAIASSIDYIHNNPVKGGLVQSAEEYPWSSASLYLNRPNDDLIDFWDGI